MGDITYHQFEPNQNNHIRFVCNRHQCPVDQTWRNITKKDCQRCRGKFELIGWCSNPKQQFLNVIRAHTCGAEIPTTVMINDFFETVKAGGPINGRDNKASADNYRNMLVDYFAAVSKNFLGDHNTPLEQLNERERESTQTVGPNIETKNNSDGQDHPTRMLRIGGEDMEPDYRSPIVSFGENSQHPWMKEKDVNELRNMIESLGNDLFVGLVGGKVGSRTSKRSYTKNLADFPDLYNLVEQCMSRYISWVQIQQPSLKYYKLAILRSDVGAGSQYDGCGKKLHSDFYDTVNKRPPQERPVSLLVALDEFEFMYLLSRKHSRGMIKTITVPPGQALAFTNYCLHAGGKNNSGKVCFRLFAYLVSDPVDFPNGEINRRYWKSVTKGNIMDDIIDEPEFVIPAESDTGIKRTRSGRPRCDPSKV